MAAAYAMLGKDDPLAAAAAVVAGYHEAFPLEEEEVALLFPLVGARLAVSVTNSALRTKAGRADPYVTVSEAPAWEALERLDRRPPALRPLRLPRGLRAPAGAARPGRRRLAASGRARRSVLDADLRTAPCLVVDLSVGSPLLGADPRHAETGPLTETHLRRDGAGGGSGRRGPLGRGARRSTSRRLFGVRQARHRRAAHDPPRHRPLRRAGDARPRAARRRRARRSRTTPPRWTTARWSSCATSRTTGRRFFTLYGHLSEDTLPALAAGQRVGPGRPSPASARRRRTATGRRTCTSS